MTSLLRAIVIASALHTGVAVCGAAMMSLQPAYPVVTRISAIVTLIAIAGGAAYGLWATWRLRWGGALGVGLAYLALLGWQLVHLVTADNDFSPISALAFGAVAAILLSPQARRACRQTIHVTPSTG